MELLNGTAMLADYTLGLDPSGRQRLVVVVKGTFTIPAAGADPEPIGEPAPLVAADIYEGEPGLSTLLYEADFSPTKPCCDVVLSGAAYAPGGRPARSVEVSLRVGTIHKTFACHGDRAWVRGLGGVVPGSPQEFVRMPISYGRAYGGVDVDPDDPRRVDAWMDNPIGVGHYPNTRGAALVDRPLPNTAELGVAVASPVDRLKSMAFGPIGRNFAGRARHAGTYDEAWYDQRFPFLPADFDPLYFQCAPPDQRLDPPVGGELIELVNLSPDGRVRFPLPSIRVPVEFTDQSGAFAEVQAVLDTIVLEPDRGRFMLTWRASRPLRRDIFEVAQVVVGRMSPGWYRARALGKAYYPSLAALPPQERTAR